MTTDEWTAWRDSEMDVWILYRNTMNALNDSVRPMVRNILVSALLTKSVERAKYVQDDSKR